MTGKDAAGKGAITDRGNAVQEVEHTGDGTGLNFHGGSIRSAS